ncbi:MAG: recombinase RecA [Euryarchaeota archaeon]|nr:recombinase RecA [Euryarchaeota archaeon]
MNNCVESGIPGFDKFISDDENGIGGIPENTSTLIYGPPKTGKSVFCYQFMYHGLSKNEPCLYLTTDYGIKQLQQRMMDFEWYLQGYMQDQMVYIIDALSSLSGTKMTDTSIYKPSSVQNPTDIMVKLGVGTIFVYRKSPKFRSIFDSLKILLAFNPDMLVVRILKAYIKRIKEAGGTAIIAHTEGTADIEIEEVIKKTADNVLRLDGELIKIERMPGIRKNEAQYQITDGGLIVL